MAATATARRSHVHAVPDLPDVTEEGQAWVQTEADDQIINCRGQGHSFPKMRLRNGKLPRGINVLPDRSGCYQIVQVCPDCGTKRIQLTLPGGMMLDRGVSYTYEWPEGYKSPKGANVTRAQCSAESWRRAANELIAQGVIAKAS